MTAYNTLFLALRPFKIKNDRMIKAFKIVSLLEGLSYLFLLFGGVPYKYVWGDPSLVKTLGMPHGMLFLAYIVMALVIKSDMKWDGKITFKVLIASILPFGTFYVNKEYVDGKYL